MCRLHFNTITYNTIINNEQHLMNNHSLGYANVVL